MNIINAILKCVVLLSATHLFNFNTQGSESQTARLLFAGDAMQHQAQLDAALAAGGGSAYDYSECFSLIEPLVSSADYAVVNLEVPLGGGPHYSGYPRFSAPDSYALALKDAGFDMCLLANNHILDSGDAAALRTSRCLAELGIDRMGVYSDKSERTTETPVIRDIKGFKIGFLNYTYGTNGIRPHGSTEIPLTEAEEIGSDIQNARRKGAELVCVFIHWGQEYVMLPGGNQRKMARALIEQGADLIIGSHPHVVQPAEIVENPVTGGKSLIVYSLGNLISNMRTAETLGGMLVDVELYRDPEGVPRIGQAAYYTHFTAKPDKRGDNFKVVPSWAADDAVPASQRDTRANSERIMEKVLSEHCKGVRRSSNIF